MGKLTALSVKNAKPGRHADGDGLYLLVKPTGGKSWLLRVQVDGQRRDIGLGSVDTSSRVGADRNTPPPITIPILHKKVLTLSEAREKAGLLRTAAKSGLDPIAERDRERRKVPTFEEAAKATHEALKSGWAEKTATIFLSSLTNHAYPSLGKMRVDQIDAEHIRDAVAPIWISKPDMARKVRFRISKVLDFAKSKGWRKSEAPRRSVTVGLAKQADGGNYAAMPYEHVPALVAQLNAGAPTKGRQALLLTILTAARSGGLVARFMWVWPEAIRFSRPRQIADTARLERLYRRLQQIHRPADETVTIPLDARAADIFEEWIADNDADVRQAAGLYASWAGKARGLALRLALTLEYLTWADAGGREPSCVSVLSLTNALTLIEDYLKPHARRVFGDAALPPVEKDAAALSRFIVKERLERINAREVQRNPKLPSLGNKQDVEAAVEALMEAGWLRGGFTRQGDGPGRPKKDYLVNPAVHGAAHG